MDHQSCPNFLSPKFCAICHTVHVHDRWLTWSRTSSLLVEAIMTTPSSGLMPAGMLSKLENHKWKLCNMNIAYAESLTHSVIALIKKLTFPGRVHYQQLIIIVLTPSSLILSCYTESSKILSHVCIYIMCITYSRKVWWGKVWRIWQIVCNLLN